jgi:hypothetical protein
MSSIKPTPSQTAVDAAIEQVLRAEAAAHESIAAARVQAAQIAEQSRSAARATTERAQRRIRRLRAAVEARVAGEVAALGAEARALAGDDTPGDDEPARLEHAVQSLAAQLTGASP